MKSPLLSILLLTILPLFLFSEENYSVTVSEKNDDDSVSTVSTLTEADIEKKQKNTVFEALESLPGLYATQSGGPGGMAGLSIRGAKPGHTLVLLDGVELNNPISVDNSCNLADIMSDNIGKIEVIRGPQAVIYGPGAMSGVIRIFTKEGTGPPQAVIKGETGLLDPTPGDISLNTWKGSGVFYGSTKSANYSFGLSYFNTDGISAAGKQYGNTEKDPYKNLTVSARTAVKANDWLSLAVSGRYINSDAAIDNGPGINKDDPNREYIGNQAFLRTEGTAKLFKDLWSQTLSVNLSWQQADDNAINIFPFQRDRFTGETIKADWKNTILWPASGLITGNRISTGVDYQASRGKLDRSEIVSDFNEIQTAGIYIQDDLEPVKNLLLSAGARYDSYRFEKNDFSFSAAAAYNIEKTGSLFRANFGMANKPPSIFQLYGTWGNSSLLSEDIKAFEFGIEQKFWNSRILIEAVYFYDIVDNLIDFDYIQNIYSNIYKSATQGIEASISARIYKNIKLTANYTYTKLGPDYRLVEVSGTLYKQRTETLRKPEHQANINIDSLFFMKLGVNLSFGFVGERRDWEYNLPIPRIIVTMKPYFTSTLAVSYKIDEKFTVFARAENLLNQRYEVVKGYGTPGISAYAGFKLGF